MEADSPEPGSPERPTVLCVDDDPGSLAGLHDALAEALRDDAVLERAASGPAAIRFIEAAFGQGLPVAVLVVAENMRELRGHQLLQQLTQLAPQIRAILIDGPVPSSDIGAAVNTGILDGLLRKPLQRGDMLGAVRSALQRWHQARRATQTQRMLEFLLQGDPSAVLLLDADNRPVHWNAAAHRIIARLADGGNLTDLSGSVLESLQREAIQNPARAGQRLTSGMEDPSSFVQQAVYGPGPDGVWAYRLTDVTESIRTSQALERSLASDGERQRIEALGMMTGAMIHELNNYLFVIGSTAELLTEQLPHETELKADLMQAVEHAGTMARQMLSFVRNDPTETEIFEVLPSIRQAVSFGRRLAAFDSQFEIAAPDAQLWTECASMHLQQIVLNLIKNALDAAGDAPSRVEISVQAGDPLLIRVRDHGPGIPAAVVPQLFKPVMTTKEAGTGAGIGLTISRRLARMHGGDLRYAESHGAGATFELLLPAADAPVRSGIAGVAATSGVLPHLRDRCVLVLEDHPRTRKLLERQLQDLGAARVHSVDSVGDFARWLKTEPSSPPDLVVSDMMLPDGAWPEIVAAINAAGLGSPILFVSGHASREFVKRLPLDNRRAFLAKPFTRPVLRRAIASLLDATAARPEDGPT